MSNIQKRILIVDDDDEIRELLEFDVSQSGYFVDTARDGLEGLNKALNNSYDLILLDVMMPKMNGFDVAKNIRQAKLAIPILMLTAKGTIDDKTEGFDCGADDYLVKPFDIQEVLLRKCFCEEITWKKIQRRFPMKFFMQEIFKYSLKLLSALL